MTVGEVFFAVLALIALVPFFVYLLSNVQMRAWLRVFRDHLDEEGRHIDK
jgi:hypothetical protein